ncbi:hypothetical protein C8R45DRAFT_1028250, partial [Mycena sanguinolenta]
MANIHNITNATSGLITNGAVLTCWALSPDVELQQKGKQTGINWLKMHQEIHEYLSRGLHEKREPVFAIFRAWDDELFPETETSLGSKVNGDSAAQSGLQQALSALSETQVVESDGGEDMEEDGEEDGPDGVEHNEDEPEDGNND